MSVPTLFSHTFKTRIYIPYPVGVYQEVSINITYLEQYEHETPFTINEPAGTYPISFPLRIKYGLYDFEAKYGAPVSITLPSETRETIVDYYPVNVAPETPIVPDSEPIDENQYMPPVDTLNPITNALNSITTPVMNFLGALWGLLTGSIEGLRQSISSVIPDIISRFNDIVKSSSDAYAEYSTKVLSSISKGSPAWNTDLKGDYSVFYNTQINNFADALNPDTYIPQVPEAPDFKAHVDKLFTTLMNQKINLSIMGIATEIGTFGQVDGFAELNNSISEIMSVDSMLSKAISIPIEKALFVGYEQLANKTYPYLIPTYSDLINMVVKEVIPLSQFKDSMLLQGYNETWSQRIWDAHFIAPNYTQVLSAYYRKAITPNQFEGLRTVIDLDPRYKTIWDALVEVVPDISELTNQLVKEVIDQKTYDTYMGYYGYDPIWTKRIWDAHFIPPTLTDILTSWRRGQISEERVNELMILVDLDPRFKEIFDTRKYRDPTVRDARYMFELNAIKEDRVKDILKRNGYSPEDTEILVQYLIKFRERGYQSRYLTALMTGYVNNAIPEDELRKTVLEETNSEGIADYIVKIGDVRRRIAGSTGTESKPKLLSVSQLSKLYALGEIDSTTLENELGLRGYETQDIVLLIELMDRERLVEDEGTRITTLSISQLLNAYRYGEMDRDDLINRLGLRGLSVQEAEILVKTHEKKWTMSGSEGGESA